ncbi:arginine--tRNA ligase [Candidatus Photodesmus katoptron]|uniref:arginine--tRNA ligase n=1 Tax=Candidatus Photodesmus anomalopis TaxID=28176 RepID=UPI00055880AD|nr:arginine--tRNA ligase [Candidatus Photodesmus katoptron]
MNMQLLINKKISNALEDAGAPLGSFADVRQSSKQEFGDYQVNGIMSIAKRLGIDSYTFAKKVSKIINLNGIEKKIEVIKPGFINIFLNNCFLEEKINKISVSNECLGIQKEISKTIVVDYSAPNIAKEMHVGHLRSTLIGDAVVRVLEFLGHEVIRVNHIGDWGTQFGMLIANLERIQKGLSNTALMNLSNLEKFYRESQKLYDTDKEFAIQARSYVVRLQSGDKFCSEMWKQLVDISMIQNQRNYERLNVSLTHSHVMGESMYNDMLPDIVTDLEKKGLAKQDNGAKVVFLDEFKNKNGAPMGVIIQKHDGGFLYTTTDIACAKYRYEQMDADRILYFVDSRQHQHLMQAWTIVRKAGYVPKHVSLEHHAFGMILGKDGRPFKTRSGCTVLLKDLLNEAESRAMKLVESKKPNLKADEKINISNIIAIAAIKYSDLSKHRDTDYVFDWDHMLEIEGNTALYIQYAYVRLISIFTKVGLSIDSFKGVIKITCKKERALVMKLLQFEEVIKSVSVQGQPHILCNYLFELAGQFSRFYEVYPILIKQNILLKQSRLQLSALIAKTIRQGLSLLGIRTLNNI